MPPPNQPPKDCLLEPDAPLARLTTLGVGGPARVLATLVHHQNLGQLLDWGTKQGLRPLILGAGSNVVIADAGLDRLVIRLAGRNIRRTTQGGQTLLCVDAGYGWDELARQLAGEGFAQLACLVGIPGTVGAAPVQNIGAYGQQVADVLAAVDVVELATGAHQTLPAEALGLGYRMSHFKGMWQGRYAITAVHLRLNPGAKLELTHKELMAAVGSATAPPHPREVALAVLALRESKGMIYNEQLPQRRHAGSFFTNPVVPAGLAKDVGEKLGPVPAWPQGALTKLSAAWLLEACGFPRGWRADAVANRVGLSQRHALALTNLDGASSADIVTVARYLQAQVFARCGVKLAAEPQFLGFAWNEL